MRNQVGFLLLLAAATLTARAQLVYEENLSPDDPAIRYTSTPATDVVATLAARLEAGSTSFGARGPTETLRELLRELDVRPDSQVLAFSKTSVQHARVSPRTPRAIYFNDRVAIAIVPGADSLELAASDPRQGVVFYTLDGLSGAKPVLTRRNACLSCHQSPATVGVPGWFVSSVFPSASGRPSRDDAIVTDHRTPFADRWGGWYVTGTMGGTRHRGNAVAPDPAAPTTLDRTHAANVTSLAGRFDAAAYLTPESDLVALMTFEHQTQMLNLFTRLGWETRMSSDGRAGARTRLDARVEDVVRYMLFADEAPLPSPMAGVSGFARTFAERGPRDGRGRSLRDFALDRRLFRYPLSYMIYSDAFDALPERSRERVYARLLDVLTGADRSPTYARLTQEDRTAVLEILRETKVGLPDTWRRASRPPRP